MILWSLGPALHVSNGISSRVRNLFRMKRIIQNWFCQPNKKKEKKKLRFKKERKKSAWNEHRMSWTQESIAIDRSLDINASCYLLIYLLCSTKSKRRSKLSRRQKWNRTIRWCERRKHPKSWPKKLKKLISMIWQVSCPLSLLALGSSLLIESPISFFGEGKGRGGGEWPFEEFRTN